MGLRCAALQNVLSLLLHLIRFMPHIGNQLWQHRLKRLLRLCVILPFEGVRHACPNHPTQPRGNHQFHILHMVQCCAVPHFCQTFPRMFLGDCEKLVERGKEMVMPGAINSRRHKVTHGQCINHAVFRIRIGGQSLCWKLPLLMPGTAVRQYLATIQRKTRTVLRGPFQIAFRINSPDHMVMQVCPFGKLPQEEAKPRRV